MAAKGGPHCSLGFSTGLGPLPHLLVVAASFSGQPQAVIMTGPLKREGVLASTVSQSNVVLTPAAIARVRDRPQCHNPSKALLSGILPQHNCGKGRPLSPVSPQAPGVTEFHSGILVTDLGHTTSSPPTSVSRLFPPSTVQDSLGKGEQVPVHGGGPQVPAAGSGECAFQSGRGRKERAAPGRGSGVPRG